MSIGTQTKLEASSEYGMLLRDGVEPKKLKELDLKETKPKERTPPSEPSENNPILETPNSDSD